MLTLQELDKTLAIKAKNKIDYIIKAGMPTDLGITNFGYVKLFEDNTRICLANTNISKWIETFYTRYFTIGFTRKPFNAYQSGFLLCSALEEQDMCTIMREQFNIDHGILVIDKQPTLTEIALFASTRENYNVINFYLNNLDVLKRFIYYFKDTCSNLIQMAEPDRAILPKCLSNHGREFEINSHLSLRRHSDTYLAFRRKTPISRYYLKNTSNLRYLTQKELDCISYLVQGKSAKEIANILDMAPKTAEMHLANIRHKLNAPNKSELVTQLLNNGLIDIQIV